MVYICYALNINFVLGLNLCPTEYDIVLYWFRSLLLLYKYWQKSSSQIIAFLDRSLGKTKLTNPPQMAICL
jgi:hypothetical protein